MKIDITAALDGIERQYVADTRQIIRAANNALDATARAIEAAWQLEMRDVFQNPTQYTLRSTFVLPTQGKNLTVTVGLKEISGKGTAAADYLAPQIDGGERKLKRFERALQSVGALPQGYRIVPGSGAKLDAYGNMDRGQITQVLSFFQSFPEAGYQANLSDRRRRQLAQGTHAQAGFAYFVGRPGDRLPLGIYQRVRFAGGTAIKPIMIMVQSAQYQPILDLKYVTEYTANRVFPLAFAAEMDRPPP